MENKETYCHHGFREFLFHNRSPYGILFQLQSRRDASVIAIRGASFPAGSHYPWCAQCGATWDFERIRCARCGTQNQGHLHYYNVEGDDAHRINTCDECGGYTRTVFQDESALMKLCFEVEDVLMARLDEVAFQLSLN